MSEHTIVWYRDLHDIPRLFCVATDGGSLIFDCRFDEVRDEYSDRYAVTFVPLPPTDADAVIDAAAACAPRAYIAVAELAFDPTRRVGVELPQ